MRQGESLIDTIPQWPWTDDDALIAQGVRSRAMIDVADSWEPERGNLFLIGGAGIGKTAALTRMVRRWIRQGSRERFVPECDVCFASSYDIENGYYPALIQLAYAAPVLIVDTLIPPTFRAGPIVSDVVRKRIRVPGLSTIIASTFPSEELKRDLGLAGELVQYGSVVEDWSYEWRGPDTADDVA